MFLSIVVGQANIPKCTGRSPCSSVFYTLMGGMLIYDRFTMFYPYSSILLQVFTRMLGKKSHLQIPAIVLSNSRLTQLTKSRNTFMQNMLTLTTFSPYLSKQLSLGLFHPCHQGMLNTRAVDVATWDGIYQIRPRSGPAAGVSRFG